MKILKIGLIVLCLPMLMISCTQTPKTITKTEYVYVTPPSSGLEEREIPDYKIETNQDMLNMLLDMKEINELHNSDKEHLKMGKNSIQGKEIQLGEEEE